MSMTRTNFTEIATILKHYHLTAIAEDRLEIHKLCSTLATYFKTQNASFDRSKFMRACGFYGE